MNKDELKSLYKGMKLLEKYNIEIFGIEKEQIGDEEQWSVTSEQYNTKDGNKWHCHGEGSDPYWAISDMIDKVKDFLANNELNK